jgi:hypothetical protein
MNGRSLSAFHRELFGEGREILLNPNLAQIAVALRRLQARARTHLLSDEEAAAAYGRVAQQGHGSAHAGVRDCPRSFKFGITSTVIQVARLTDRLIACSIGRQQVLPGEKGKPPVAADPHDDPRQWLKEVLATFWTVLDAGQIAAIEQSAVSSAMALAATRQHCGRGQAHGPERAAVRRRLQLQALFRSIEPVYVSELKLALTRTARDLRADGEERVAWRVFQRRWPSIAMRYRRDLLQLFRQGSATRQALSEFSAHASNHRLRFTTWSGAQTIFPATQLVFQVCSPLLSVAEGAGHRSSFALRRTLCEMAERSPHPVTPDTVGWLRVHVDDLHRLVFIDEVQSDVMEHLLALAAEGDTVAAALAKQLSSWQVDGFSSVQHWAAAIGYRVAMHSEQSAAAIEHKTRSPRKWQLYYGSLSKRFALVADERPGYPGPIFIGL